MVFSDRPVFVSTPNVVGIGKRLFLWGGAMVGGQMGVEGKSQQLWAVKKCVQQRADLPACVDVHLAAGDRGFLPPELSSHLPVLCAKQCPPTQFIFSMGSFLLVAIFWLRIFLSRLYGAWPEAQIGHLLYFGNDHSLLHDSLQQAIARVFGIDCGRFVFRNDELQNRFYLDGCLFAYDSGH